MTYHTASITLSTQALSDLIQGVLEDKKAVDIVVLDLKHKSSLTDVIIIASGTSQRHLKALAHYVEDALKDSNQRPLGIEGENGSDWIVIDCGSVMAHLFLPEARELYDLEKIWTIPLVGPLSPDAP